MCQKLFYELCSVKNNLVFFMLCYEILRLQFSAEFYKLIHATIKWLSLNAIVHEINLNTED